jgi:creatinine amidohydrolase
LKEKERREMELQFPTWNMGHLAYPDVQEYLKHKDIVMVPVASMEQHSYHLPLLTDSLHGERITQIAAEYAHVMYTPQLWVGYSPHHMGPPGLGIGTITVRSETWRNMMYDICRSLIHHGFNKIIIVNCHGSNMKIIDPLIRSLKYDTGALIGVCKPWAENYLGLVADILEGPPEETPGWHSGELETSQILSVDEKLVRMDRAIKSERTKTPPFLPDAFLKKDGTPNVEFEGYNYFVFPMEHREFSDTGLIGNPLRASKQKGDECNRRYGEHLGRALKELERVKVEVKNREWLNRV